MKFLKNIFITSILSVSMLMPQFAEAGKISKAAGAYATYKAVKGAVKVGKNVKGASKFRGDIRRYVRQLEETSGIKLNREQIAHLKSCVRDPKCLTNEKNPNKFPSNNLKKKWSEERKTPWPKHKEDTFYKDGTPAAQKGWNYDAHHIIPKGNGGPHATYNLHPVPRVGHLEGVHKSGSPLHKLQQSLKGLKK